MQIDDSEETEMVTCVGCKQEVSEDEVTLCGSCGESVCSGCVVETGPQALGAVELCPACAEESGVGDDDDDDDGDDDDAVSPEPTPPPAGTFSTPTKTVKASSVAKKSAGKVQRAPRKPANSAKTPSGAKTPRAKPNPTFAETAGNWA